MISRLVTAPYLGLLVRLRVGKGDWALLGCTENREEGNQMGYVMESWATQKAERKMGRLVLVVPREEKREGILGQLEAFGLNRFRSFIFSFSKPFL
jgi:hypothetical protein